MTKTLNTPPGGYLLFKNDVWANPDRLAITTQSRKFARFETRGFGGRSLAAILEWRKSSAFQVGAWRQMPDADAAVPAATTPFIIGSEVDVSCVFVFGPWR